MAATQKGKSYPAYRHKKVGWVLCIGVLVIIIVTCAVVYFVLFKPEKPRIAVQSMELQSIYFGGFPETIQSLNVTLVLGVWVHNSNKGTYYFTESDAFLYFYGTEVGFTRIALGSIASDSSKNLNFSLTVAAPKYIGGALLYADVAAKIIPLTTGVMLSGHVTALNIFSREGSATSLCAVNISLVTHNIIDYTCKYGVWLGVDNGKA